MHYDQMKDFQPYLENSRHSQIPQWEHKDWYLEDWFTQEKGMDMVKGFYKADIFRDQFQTQPVLEHQKSYSSWLKTEKKINNHIKTLVVGPGFYHLSGFDKRRVVAILDATYGVTKYDKTASFILEDWNTLRPIGFYNQSGLTLF